LRKAAVAPMMAPLAVATAAAGPPRMGEATTVSDFVRGRMIRGLRQKQTILAGLLHGLGQDDARRATDGPDGWSVVEVVCHLRDLEEVYLARLEQMLAGGTPTFARFAPNEVAREHEYATQDLRAAHADFREERRRFVARLEALAPAGWAASGVHPVYGEQTVERLAFQVLTHDLDHLDQIARCLGRAERFG
jgi:hypothetical protein